MSVPQDARGGLERLENSLADAFDPDEYGFPWYASIDDRAVRAVRSNQTIGLIDAAASHLTALGDAAHEVRDLVGPNGRTMPAPDDVAGNTELARIYVKITDALRAAGSLLDVLGGLAVLFLGLPVSPPFADSRQLLTDGYDPAAPSAEQRRAMERFRVVVDEAVKVGPCGWVAWTLESRNAMVHRGRAIAIWLPVPTAAGGQGMFVVTDMKPMHVIRQFPHMRRQPDLSDAESVLSGRSLEETILRESAQETLDGLHERMGAFTAAVVAVLYEMMSDLPTFVWPREQWRIARRSDRAILADEFAGFGTGSDASDLTALFVNPREGKRLSVMERLRREQSDATGSSGAG